MSPDKVRIAEAKSWLVKAARDLRAATHEFHASPPLLDDIVFHCQQSVEKSCKAFLAWHDVPFRKTHDLVELGRQCSTIQPELDPLLRKAAPLTEYAWKFRYPGEAEEPDRQEADDAYALASEIFRVMVSRLPEETRP